MSRSICRFGVAALLMLSSGVLPAYDIWAFRFVSYADAMSRHDDLIFHNATSQDAVVRLVGLSNGPVASDDLREIPVPAGRTVSLWNRWGV